ncbi:dTMP kinase [Streptomyces xinghaiensis]|uniref:dTMP kinase n=1 Tax=Streptomyces xinghaiensis TaxID=1038928 RepID=UPI00378BF7E2
MEEEVRPALARGEIVVCDRYVPSSLVLQVMDGVPRDVVWELNRHADMPDLAVIVNARAEVIAERLDSRGTRHSRYEREPRGTERECAYYYEAASSSWPPASASSGWTPPRPGPRTSPTPSWRRSKNGG